MTTKLVYAIKLLCIIIALISMQNEFFFPKSLRNAQLGKNMFLVV